MKPIFEITKPYRQITIGILFGTSLESSTGYIDRFTGFEIYLFKYHIAIGVITNALEKR